ncbi:helix-turn-helix domain-containing protein [Carboxylicivirga marina]|uniref:Helix-turn-helix transcriptional regulator n=1 Tax=Carboxylicivirga marina TaxID=2800988 RepID=A0ABS1HIF8_9BACT|nr:helix-turn-helix transcriptional regulator [Carboxylicivirga marina]MBK3517406.1 helix-turn-helix transcriptional regulator [Carboxylicivirga marina]
MIKYSFDRIFKARGIARPFSFLKKHGFSDNFASRLKNNRVSRLNLHHLEKLCLVLRCTPNDIMEWKPSDTTGIDAEHPLNLIKRPDQKVDMVKTINSIPLGQLEEIEKLINERIGKGE